MGLLTTIKTDFDFVGRVREVLSMFLIEGVSNASYITNVNSEPLTRTLVLYHSPIEKGQP